jgi:hypothetical protein
MLNPGDITIYTTAYLSLQDQLDHAILGKFYFPKEGELFLVMKVDSVGEIHYTVLDKSAKILIIHNKFLQKI